MCNSESEGTHLIEGVEIKPKPIRQDLSMTNHKKLEAQFSLMTCMTPDVTAANTPVKDPTSREETVVPSEKLINHNKTTLPNVSPLQKKGKMRPMDEVWFLTPVFAKHFPNTDEALLQYQIRKKNFDLKSVDLRADDHFCSWQKIIEFNVQVQQPPCTKMTEVSNIPLAIDTENAEEHEILQAPACEYLRKRRNALIPRQLFEDEQQQEQAKLKSRSSEFLSQNQKNPTSKYPNKLETVNNFYLRHQPREPRRDKVLADMIAEENRYRLINVSPSIHNARFFKPLKDISTCSMPIISK